MISIPLYLLQFNSAAMYQKTFTSSI